MRLFKRPSRHRRPCALLGTLPLVFFAFSAPSARAQTPDAPATPAQTPDTSTTPVPATGTPGTQAPPDQTSPSPEPPKEHHARIGVGLDLGLFTPTSGHTRDRFGDSWFSVGLGIGSIRKASTRGHFAFEASTLYKKTSDRHAFFAPVGVEYRRALATGTSAVPYAGVSGEVVFADLRSPEDNVHSGFRETAGGSAFIGTTFGEHGFLEARYLFISKVKGFDLSGLNLTAGVRF